MTEAEAQRLLAEGRREGARLCVRYESTTDGSVHFRPALVSAPSRAFAMLAGIGAMLLTGCSEPRLIAVEDEVCVYDGSRGPQRVARGDGDCPPRVEVPDVEPLLWVELEPKPVMPNLAPAQEPAPRKTPKAEARPKKREKTMGIPVAIITGSPLDGL